jgi:hypothetical protein
LLEAGLVICIGLARNGLTSSKVLSNLITLLGTLKIPSPWKEDGICLFEMQMPKKWVIAISSLICFPENEMGGGSGSYCLNFSFEVLPTFYIHPLRLSGDQE